MFYSLVQLSFSKWHILFEVVNTEPFISKNSSCWDRDNPIQWSSPTAITNGLFNTFWGIHPQSLSHSLLLFPSLSEPLPESKAIMGGKAKESCSHSEGRRQADLWGKILKALNTHSLGQQPWVRNWGGLPFTAKKPLGWVNTKVSSRKGAKMQIPPFWEELTGSLSLVNWPKVLHAFLSLNSCNSVMQLTPPLGEWQIEHYSMETPRIPIHHSRKTVYF